MLVDEDDSIEKEEKITEERKRSLEDLFSVPQMRNVGRDGKVSMGFSTSLKDVSYDSIYGNLNDYGKLKTEELRSLKGGGRGGGKSKGGKTRKHDRNEGGEES